MEIIVFCGIQASGKSTFYKEYFFNTHVRISMDLLKTRHREALFIDTCYSSEQSFVVDNTNPTITDRKRYIVRAKEKGIKIICYYFQSKIELAIQRNGHRQGKDLIPDIAIKGTFNKLEVPSFDEGFDELYYVQISNNKFEISNWES